MTHDEGYMNLKIFIFSFVQIHNCQQQNSKSKVRRQVSVNIVCCNLWPLEYSLVISSSSLFSSTKVSRK